MTAITKEPLPRTTNKEQLARKKAPGTAQLVSCQAIAGYSIYYLYAPLKLKLKAQLSKAMTMRNLEGHDLRVSQRRWQSYAVFFIDMLCTLTSPVFLMTQVFGMAVFLWLLKIRSATIRLSRDAKLTEIKRPFYMNIIFCTRWACRFKESQSFMHFCSSCLSDQNSSSHERKRTEIERMTGMSQMQTNWWLPYRMPQKTLLSKAHIHTNSSILFLIQGNLSAIFE